MTLERAYDVIVVGGGTSGAVVARRVAEAGDLRVALIEEGPSDEGVDVIARLRRWQELLGHERYGRDYRIEPQPRGNGKILHSRGVMLGGCSSHNSSIAFVPPDHDFERWETSGAAGWGPSDVAPFFRRVRERVGFERSDSDNALVRSFLDAAAQAGYPEIDFREGVREGAGLFELNKRGELRSSSSAAYLHPLSSLPPNLTVLTDTPVLRVIFEGDRAAGVETPGGVLHAEREVVVSAGTFASPQLLQRSGVGAGALLRGAGVPVRHELPAVGEHLQDHPEGVVLFGSARPVPERTYNHYEAGLFARVDADAAWPDLMFHFGTQAFDLHTLPAGYPSAENAFSFTPNVARARSEGYVRIRSGEAGEAPSIDFRYFSDPDGYDERIMVEGVRLAREIVCRPALRPWVGRELAPGPDATSFRDLSAYVRSTANTVYHPVGTCRMGASDDDGAVVDPQLRVRGLRGLRVADASIMPSIVSTNPAVTCMMIGERAADEILTS